MAELFNKDTYTGKYWDVAVAIHRTNAAPLDSTEIFTSYNDALAYAQTGATAYFGQCITVAEIEGDLVKSVKPYIIVAEADGVTGTLQPIATGTIDISGDVVNVYYDAVNDKFYNEDLDPDHEHPLTDISGLKKEAGVKQYLKLTIGEDDMYIATSDLISLEDYYKKAEVDAKLDVLDSSIDTRLNSDETRLDTLDSSVNALEAAVDALEEIVDGNLKEHLEQLDSSVNALEARADAADTAISTLEDELLDQAIDIANLDSSVADLKAKDAALDASVKDHETRITALEAGTKEEIEKIEDHLDALDASTVANAEAAEAAQETADEAKELAEKNEGRLNTIDGSIAGLDASVKAIDGKLEDLKSEIEEEIEGKLADVDTSINELRDKDAEHDEAIEALQEAIEDFMDSSLVKTIKTESLSDYVVLTPATATTGDVTISADLKVVSMADASTSNMGLAEASDVKAYVLKQIADAGHLKYKVVASLPAVGEENIIYLVKAEDPHRQQGDVYNEYMWINNAWEKIGDTTLDLDNYYTKTQVDEKLDTLDASVKSYVDTSIETLEESIQEFLDEVEIEIADLSTKIAAANASIANLDSSVKDAFEENERQAEAISNINDAVGALEDRADVVDSSILKLDSSVKELEEKLENGVVSSVTSDSVEETGYVRLTENVKATGNVEMHLDADVVEHYEDIRKDGLATTNYVEERFAWIEIEEPATADELEPIGEHGSYTSDDQPISITDAELETLKTTEAGNIDIESQKEITIG